MKITPEMSKKVGWKPRSVKWPTLEEVETASDEELLTWHRFLPGAKNREHLAIIGAIERRFREDRR